MIPKPPKSALIDDVEYKEFKGYDEYNQPEFAEAVAVSNCRIDRSAEYTSDRTGRQLLYNAVVFCCAGITSPMPEFKNESIVIIDGIEHVITKVIPNYEPFKNTLYSYELEVV